MDSLSSKDAEAVVRAIEAAAEVKRGYQFFVWMQTHLRGLIPHEFAVCGAYQRGRRELVLEAFNSVSVPQSMLATLTDPGSALMQQAIGSWIQRRGRATRLNLLAFDGAAVQAELSSIVGLGFSQMIMHGVSRPQRPSEIESLFLLSNRGPANTDDQLAMLDLLLPHLHTTYLRVQATEREVMGSPPLITVPHKAATATSQVTQREKQILVWVREGKSNQQIGEQLDISPLTVKNHIQKILRKLGASNRAHAVAMAMALNLLGTTRAEDRASGDV